MTKHEEIILSNLINASRDVIKLLDKEEYYATSYEVLEKMSHLQAAIIEAMRL